MPIRLVTVAVSGVLLSLSFEPAAIPWLIPLSLAGFILATRGLSTRGGLLVGAVFGATFYAIHIVWMQAVGLPAWIALSGLETLFYAAMGAISAHAQRRSWWPLWFAAAWTTAEVARSGWPLGGMPWGRLAFAVIDTPLASALPYVGAVAVSFLLALLSAQLVLVALALRRGEHGWPALAALAAICGAMTLPVLVPWSTEGDEGRTVQIAVVQGNVPGAGDDILLDFRKVTRNHVEATVALADDVAAGVVPRPDFVLWPENSTATDPFRDRETNSGIRTASTAIGVPILVGAIVDGGPNQVLNQGIVWDPETEAGERYTKRHPVPFGEYIPARAVFTRYNFFDRLRDVGRDMLAGTRDQPLMIAGVRVADAICFDIAYDDGIRAQMREGAQMLVVQTSNATFIATKQIQQQFAITRIRAIETGRWTAVASTNGITGIIGPDGEVAEIAAPRTQDVLVHEVTLTDRLTPAMRVGLWSPWFFAGLALLGLVLARRDTRSREPAVGAPTDDDADLEADVETSAAGSA